MDITSIVFGVLFCIEGTLLLFGKINIFTKAWKNTPQEEKDKINIKGLCRNIGEVIILAGIIFLFNGLWSFFQDNLFIVSMIAWAIVCIIDLLYIIKGRRYQKNNHFKKQQEKEE